jgi:hypothetical protein
VAVEEVLGLATTLEVIRILEVPLVPTLDREETLVRVEVTEAVVLLTVAVAVAVAVLQLRQVFQAGHHVLEVQAVAAFVLLDTLLRKDCNVSFCRNKPR